MMSDLSERVKHDFKLHPMTPAAGPLMDETRRRFTEVAVWAAENLPAGRDLSMAITDLETAQRCAIAAIAKNQEQIG